MFCSHCGTENNDSSRYCKNCGASLNVQPASNPSVPTQPASVPPTMDFSTPAEPGKGFAITGMICGIVSFFCFGVITGILGIVFGGIAKSKGYTGAMATAGIACGAVSIALWLLLIMLGFVPLL